MAPGLQGLGRRDRKLLNHPTHNQAFRNEHVHIEALCSVEKKVPSLPRETQTAVEAKNRGQALVLDAWLVAQANSDSTLTLSTGRNCEKTMAFSGR